MFSYCVVCSEVVWYSPNHNMWVHEFAYATADHMPQASPFGSSFQYIINEVEEPLD